MGTPIGRVFPKHREKHSVHTEYSFTRCCLFGQRAPLNSQTRAPAGRMPRRHREKDRESAGMPT